MVGVELMLMPRSKDKLFNDKLFSFTYFTPFTIMKQIYLFLLILVLILVACQEDTMLPLNVPTIETKEWLNEPLSREEINSFAYHQIQRFGEFDWGAASDFMVYSAAVRTDSLMAVGFNINGFENANSRMHEVNMQEKEWLEKRQEVINYIVEVTNQLSPENSISAENLMPYGLDDYLPAIDIKIFHPDLVHALRKRADIRYVEPMGYGLELISLRSGIGCNSGAGNINNIKGTLVEPTSPNALVSWNHKEMKIDKAWNVSSGKGISIAILDTGTSPTQAKLNGLFNEGESTGRTLTRKGFYRTGSWWNNRVDGPDDPCSHGTQMAGLAVAPKGNDQSIVGAAYGANLVALRVTNDVYLNGSNEKRGLADGLIYSANRSDVKVISISLLNLLGSSRVSDAIKYAHGKGKLIFAAAGTTIEETSWLPILFFPANMKETIAVTGVFDDYPLERCRTCHDGSKVDFVSVVESRNGSKPLTLANSGNYPKRSGGSSAATATVAGIAALVWATNPSMSTDQVLERLKKASQFRTQRDENFGWGRIDANAAVRGKVFER